MTTRLLFSSADDNVPNQFTFTDVINAQLNTVISSNTITVSGLSPNITVTVTASGGTVDAGTSGLSGTYASSKTVQANASGSFVMAARVTSSSNYVTSVNCVVTINGVSDTFTVTTRNIDGDPDPFTIPQVGDQNGNGADPGVLVTTSTITVTGLEPNYPITVNGGASQVDAGTSTLSGTWASNKTVTTSASGTLVFAARITSNSTLTTPPVQQTYVSASVQVGSGVASWLVYTRRADTTPNAFSFTDSSNVERSTVVTSNTVTVNGLEPNYPITVSASNGQIDAGTSALSGTWETSKTVTTSATGTLVVAARSTSSSSFSTAVNVAVTVGTGSDTYTITTRAPVLNGSFSFTDISGAAKSTVYTSNTVTATGFEPNYTFTVSASGGTVDAGTSALSGTFASSKSVTTSATGTLVIAARLTSSSSFNTATNCTVTVGNSSDTYTVTTESGDTTPDAYSFTELFGQNYNTVVTSNTVTFTGINDTTSWSVTNGEGLRSGTSTWATSGTLNPGDSLTLRTTTPSTSGTLKNVTVTVGGVAETWGVTTKDHIADAFSFTNVTNATVSTVYTSNTVTVTGLEPNSSITITSSGGTVDAGTTTLSGTFDFAKTVTTSATGTLVVAARVTSSNLTNTTETVSVVVGLSSAVTYSVKTVVDAMADAFSFTEVTGAQINTQYTTDVVTVTGLSPNFQVLVTCSPSASLSTIAFYANTYVGNETPLFSQSTTVTTSTSGTFQIKVRGVSSSSYNTATAYIINVGSVTGTFKITTRAADLVPNAFSFTDVTGATRSTVYTSNTVTVTGLDASQSITVSATGGTVDAGTSALSGTFAASKNVATSATGTIVIAARVTASASYSTAVNCTVTIGGVSDIYTVTTTYAPGAVTFTTSGSSGTWTVPANVTSICMVAIGGGGKGSRDGLTWLGGNSWSNQGPSYAGGGGALAYVNNVPVTPGEILDYSVGQGATETYSLSAGSYVKRSGVGAEVLVSAGAGQSFTGVGGTVGVGTGGSGGAGNGGANPTGSNCFGGGGAGGYTGAGGNSNTACSTGGGGGGGNAQATAITTYARHGGGGGGAGLNGYTSGTAAAGANATTTTYGGGGGGGSGGTAGQAGKAHTSSNSWTGGGNGGTYGGGGGSGRGSGTSDAAGEAKGGNGAAGAIRIIWGVGRSFPSNAA